MTAARFSIDWGARSRNLDARSTALSVVVTIGGGAGSNGQDVTVVLNRTNQTASYREDVVTPQQVKVGTWPVTVRLFAQPDGLGDVVGRADASPAIQPNGEGIGAIATTGLVTTVQVVPGQSVLVGQTKDIAYTAKNAEGQVLAITLGSGLFTLVGGGDRIRLVNGIAAEALKPGTATVRVSVDGVSSANTTLAVTSNATVQVDPPNREVGVKRSADFTAAVGNTPDTTVTWKIEEGAAGGTQAPSGGNGTKYTAPATVGTFHLVATSQYDPAKSGAATITVIPAVTIQPSPVTTTLRKETQFTATVEGIADTSVNWSINEGAAGGSIDANGKYTAPATAGVFHITATSRADDRAKATVTVTVKAGSGTVIIQ